MSVSWFKVRTSLWCSAGLVALELTSWLTYAYPPSRGLVTGLLLLVILIVSCYRLAFGVYVVLAELVIGSQGYILAIPLPQFTISFRLGLFVVMVLATAIDVIRQRRLYGITSFFWKWYVAVVAWLCIGVVVGYLHGNSISNIFFDANGYLFLGMIIPFTQAARQRHQLYTIITIIISGVLVLTVQTLLIVFVFSHQIFFQYYLSDLYRWIRDFRLGEITRQPNGFYRVFFQSQMYVVFVMLFSLLMLLRRWQWWAAGVTAVSVMLLWLSYSRSFWIAVVAVLAGLWLYARCVEKRSWRAVWLSVATVIGSALVTYGLVLVVINMRIGNDPGSSVAAGSFFSERTEDPWHEAAGGSRLALLGPLLQRNLSYPLLGGGLGTTVTYATHDPRALASNPTGRYTTFAFEWGYLDLWLKLGLGGTATYLILLALLARRSFSVRVAASPSIDQVLATTAGFGIIALAFVHALTPYLNHPLGIGWLACVTVITDIYARSR